MKQGAALAIQLGPGCTSCDTYRITLSQFQCNLRMEMLRIDYLMLSELSPTACDGAGPPPYP